MIGRLKCMLGTHDYKIIDYDIKPYSIKWLCRRCGKKDVWS